MSGPFLAPSLPLFLPFNPSHPSSFAVDAVFAVYEATSLELWSFFSYTAYDGSPSPVSLVALYYFTMVFYLVIFVQVQTRVPIEILHDIRVCMDAIAAKYISGGHHRVIC